MSRGRRRAGVVLLAMVPIVGACGSSAPTDPPSTIPSRAQTWAEGVCAAAGGLDEAVGALADGAARSVEPGADVYQLMSGPLEGAGVGFQAFVDSFRAEGAPDAAVVDPVLTDLTYGAGQAQAVITELKYAVNGDAAADPAAAAKVALTLAPAAEEVRALASGLESRVLGEADAASLREALQPYETCGDFFAARPSDSALRAPAGFDPAAERPIATDRDAGTTSTTVDAPPATTTPASAVPATSPSTAPPTTALAAPITAPQGMTFPTSPSTIPAGRSTAEVSWCVQAKPVAAGLSGLFTLDPSALRVLVDQAYALQPSSPVGVAPTLARVADVTRRFIAAADAGTATISASGITAWAGANLTMAEQIGFLTDIGDVVSYINRTC